MGTPSRRKVIPLSSSVLQLAWNARAVTVVTSKDDMNDKIHVVPQVNFGSGQLDQPNALVFDGFGKILDFTVAGLYK